jgi:hypothetical protein
MQASCLSICTLILRKYLPESLSLFFHLNFRETRYLFNEIALFLYNFAGAWYFVLAVAASHPSPDPPDISNASSSAADFMSSPRHKAAAETFQQLSQHQTPASLQASLYGSPTHSMPDDMTPSIMPHSRVAKSRSTDTSEHLRRRYEAATDDNDDGQPEDTRYCLTSRKDGNAAGTSSASCMDSTAAVSATAFGVGAVGAAVAAAAVPRRRAVDMSDLRHCALVQTHLKTAANCRNYG